MAATSTAGGTGRTSPTTGPITIARTITATGTTAILTDLRPRAPILRRTTTATTTRGADRPRAHRPTARPRRSRPTCRPARRSSAWTARTWARRRTTTDAGTS